MTQAKHALGPWAMNDWASYDADGAIDACGTQVIDANGCMVMAGHLEGESEEGEANTRLIAAAPTLLMALEFLLDQAESFNVSGVYFNQFRENRDALDTAHDAIALAIGKGRRNAMNSHASAADAEQAAMFRFMDENDCTAEYCQYIGECADEQVSLADIIRATMSSTKATGSAA